MEEKPDIKEINTEILPIAGPQEQRVIDINTLSPKQKVITLLKLGNSLKTSIEFAGIDNQIYGIWIKNDPNFEEEVKKARAEADLFDCEVIRKATGQDWKASVFRIQRRDAAEKRKKYSVRVGTHKECRRFIQKVITEVLNDEMELDKAKCIATLVQCAIKIIEVYDIAEKLKEQEEAIRQIKEQMQK